jgi:hypothetical protein
MCTSRQLAGILARFSLLIRPFESKLNGKDVLLFIGEVSDNPQWVQVVLDRFDSKTEPHNEVEIAQELANERALHGTSVKKTGRPSWPNIQLSFSWRVVRVQVPGVHTSPQWLSGLRAKPLFAILTSPS